MSVHLGRFRSRWRWRRRRRRTQAYWRLVIESERREQGIEKLEERAEVSAEAPPAKPLPITGTETSEKRQRRFAHPDDAEIEVGNRSAPSGPPNERPAPELFDA